MNYSCAFSCFICKLPSYNLVPGYDTHLVFNTNDDEYYTLWQNEHIQFNYNLKGEKLFEMLVLN